MAKHPFLADRRPTEQYGRAYGTMFCPSVCRQSVTFVLWLNGTAGDDTVGQAVGKFLQAAIVTMSLSGVVFKDNDKMKQNILVSNCLYSLKGKRVKSCSPVVLT